MKQRWQVGLILFVALLVRLAAWWILPYRDWISDEGEYWGAAVWLAEGRDFSFFDGWIWTRPPLYVMFLAAHVKLFGSTALWAPRLTQALLSTLMVWLAMRVGRRLAPVGREHSVALITGWLMALSYSFASFAFFLLSETLFITGFLAACLFLLRWADHKHRRDLLIAAALLGVCVLTRAIILTWMPVVALWVLWQARNPTASGWQRWRMSLLNVALLTAIVCSFVFPWTAYATNRWSDPSHLILVDTTGGYNWALGAQSALPSGRDGKVLHDLLCGGKFCDPEANHGERQAQAYALGSEWIVEHPLGFLRKTGRELLDMVQLRYGGAERIREGYTIGMVPAGHLLGLLSDDTLYVVMLIFGLVGLFGVQARPGKSLVLSWILYHVAIGALVFAINRFRQPLLPFLAIYAACAWVQWREPWRGRRWFGYAALAMVLYAMVLPSYIYWPQLLDPGRRSVWQDTYYGFQGLHNAARCEEIEQVLEQGRVAEARQLHDAADAEQPLQCLARIHARLLVAEGRTAEALAFLADADPENNALLASRILLIEGDIWRNLGDPESLQKAREVFTDRDVEITNDTLWAWHELDPPPTNRIDLGDGLDYGYMRGFYQREAGDPSFRWSMADSALRFPQAGTGVSQQLVLRVNGYTTRPAPTTLTPFFNGTALPSMTLEPGWQDIVLELPPTAAGEDVIIEFHSTVFVPGPADLAERVRDNVSQQLRLLGFQLDWAELR